MNYGIFRSEPIMTLNDLAQIGSHNKREKKAYKSNPNIKLELTKNNIELVPLAEKYAKGFKMLVKNYEKEHNDRMKIERDDRKRTFTEMLNKSKSVVADELLFTATNKFFKDKDKDFILGWANTCMDFVYNDLGYTKEQILHATLHLDEATPHIHCVVVPLVKKLDKRTNTERYTISKKQYIKDKLHLSQLQDIYNDRLREKGYDLERGIKGSNAKHQKVREFKKTTRYYENKVDTYTKSHQTLEKENQNMQREIKSLKTRNHNLIEENNNLKSYTKAILEAIKHFFRELLQIGNDKTKEVATTEIKDYYDNQDFDMYDVKDISKGTTKEDELFDYAGVPSYLKASKKSHNEKDKDDFEISL